MGAEVSGGESAAGPQAVGGAENLDHDPTRCACRRRVPRRRPRLAIAHQRRPAGVVETEEAIGDGEGAVASGMRGIAVELPYSAKAAQGPPSVSPARSPRAQELCYKQK